MNIVFTLHTTMNQNAGGASVIQQLATEYRRLGHQVHIYSFDDLPQTWPIQAICLAFPWYVARFIQQLSRQHPIHVLDASTSDGWVWGLGRFRHPETLYVSHSHGLEHVLNGMLWAEAQQQQKKLSWQFRLYWDGFHLWEVGKSLRQADLALFLNQADRDYALQHLGVSVGKARVLGNGIPANFLSLPWTETIMQGKLGIAQIGSYIPGKGIHYTAPAVSKILDRHPQVFITFLGTSYPPEQVLRDYPARLHNRIRVIPQFNHADLPQLLADHQIKLFPTLYDGFGLALLEAMACGLAPITTATSGPLSIVQHQQDAWVVPPGDAEALEQALELLITNRSLLDQLRRNAYAKAQQYGWSHIARQRLQLYEEFRQAIMVLDGSLI